MPDVTTIHLANRAKTLSERVLGMGRPLGIGFTCAALDAQKLATLVADLIDMRGLSDDTARARLTAIKTSRVNLLVDLQAPRSVLEFIAWRADQAHDAPDAPTWLPTGFAKVEVLLLVAGAVDHAALPKEFQHVDLWDFL